MKINKKSPQTIKIIKKNNIFTSKKKNFSPKILPNCHNNEYPKVTKCDKSLGIGRPVEGENLCI